MAVSIIILITYENYRNLCLELERFKF